MAKSSAKTSTHKEGSFAYFFLGILIGLIGIIVTIMLQSAVHDGKASLMNSYGTRGITSPQTKNSIMAPKMQKAITSPQTKAPSQMIKPSLKK